MVTYRHSRPPADSNSSDASDGARPRNGPPEREVEAGTFDSLILQGGGCRCFFTLGFLEVATQAGAFPEVRQIATVSASAAMACAHLIDGHRSALEIFAAGVRKNPKNFYVSRLLRGERPTPHYDMYRAALIEAIPDVHFARIRDSAIRLRILVSHSRGTSRTVATLLGALSILTQQRPPGLDYNVIDAQTLPDRLALVDAVLASSAFPPFTPLPELHGRPIIDGGAIEPIPLSALDRKTAQRPLILLTRPRPVRPLPPGLHYVAPPVDLNLAIWQYADEPGLRRVYEMGLRCGEAFLKHRRVKLS
jgi:predicted acylesterase/phospholipase RssA